MKRIAIISLIICIIIGLSVGIYDILHPIMPNEYGAEYTNLSNWNTIEFWEYAIEWIGILIGIAILVLFLPVFFIGLLIRHIKSKS